MDKKSKILAYCFFALIIAVVVFAIYKYIVIEDYYIRMETSCEPTAEKCFVRECDIVTAESCSTIPEERLSYYKIIEKRANMLPDCNLAVGDCPEIFCSVGEDCQEFFCDSEIVPEGETCIDPEQFAASFTVTVSDAIETVEVSSSTPTSTQ